MKIGLVGLGKMGLNLTKNMINKGYEVYTFDKDSQRIRMSEKVGAIGCISLKNLCKKLKENRILWIMVPSGNPTEDVLNELKNYLDKKDIIIEAGNSNYKDSMRRFENFQNIDIDYLDAGISGGQDGALNGICAMIGGKESTFKKVERIFKDISIENGYLYTGKSGSGHFSKMIHNGIEYGMLQAIGEGFEILEKSDFDYDMESLADLWNHGSVIRGWLMELTKNVFNKDKNLDTIKGVIDANGEGLWTAQTALEMGIPAPVITASVMVRHRSKQEDTYSGKLIASLRNEFGGHSIIENK
ncbi:6-phosphogluconate dehydrogenase [Oceanotoga teriensis]|uniref:6-phosphogluconate dehydrogenase n=1 Tax=Oceanotoga teriensis TaxID=515440 RepID=A0AA45C514_9BACT|nr:decarboxylating 6-phosphogluconate dehydrogenase [Oceanotoga teriensis]PWJ87875.1 6-phosphogluconate dehydrogenase [Oceanotoga teriensis]